MKQPKPDSLWLVLYECRYTVVQVSHCGKWFYAPGQDAAWSLNDAAEWISEIEKPTQEHPHGRLVPNI